MPEPHMLAAGRFMSGAALTAWRERSALSRLHQSLSAISSDSRLIDDGDEKNASIEGWYPQQHS